MPTLSITPDTSVKALKGVGPKLEATLTRLGIFRVIDLLLHLPLRYQDRSRVTPIAHLRAGEEALIQARIANTAVTFGKSRSLIVDVEDSSGRAKLRFFHFSRYQQKALSEAVFIRAYGEFRFYGRNLTCAHPEYTTYTTDPGTPTPTLTPIYPITQGLGQTRLRNLATQVCALDWPHSPGTPYDKLRYLHQPPAEARMEDIADTQADIARDELTAYYLVMKGRALARQKSRAIELPRSQALGRTLLENLGFHLTKAQARVVSEVLTDLEKPVPMLRLVQGDVGSGKTVIAAFAAIRAAEQGCQTAVMAPTELLAEQHYLNFSAWLDPLGIRVTLLTGQMTQAQQKSRLEEIASGDSSVVIGTHALFQQRVHFARLALSIIDEQHRFGVHQRMALQHKSVDERQPHQLVMTATPIPRTLTMALYADMDVSVIDELPKGRQPITTQTISENDIGAVTEQLLNAIKRGEQAYWVCTLIDESDDIPATAVTQRHETLVGAFPDLRIALLHGRMKSEDKVSVMQAFKAHDVDLLVATTVVEVGVDVPNATQMVIENAERLGLAQLHQLRGRIGRGSLPSFCYLLHNQALSETAQVRLQVMRESQDGFHLAEQDLKLRGPGDILGTRQAGEQSFRVADLNAHAHLMPEVIRRGDRLLQAAPGSEERELMGELLNAWAGGYLSKSA